MKESWEKPPPGSPAWRDMAVHEAGHAVVAELRGRRVKTLTLEPTEDGIGVAGCELEPFTLEEELPARLDPQTFRTLAMYGFGGPLAEARLTGNAEYRSGWDDDLSNILDALRVLVNSFGDSVNPESLYDEVRAETEELLDRNWRKVGDLAGALLAAHTLYGDQVRAVLAGLQDGASGPPAN